uniref:Uncharacterized protein n=1 Tax=Arundo donax TaxID=35708 RepID=A0A0A9HE30_ARUDO
MLGALGTSAMLVSYRCTSAVASKLCCRTMFIVFYALSARLGRLEF